MSGELAGQSSYGGGGVGQTQRTRPGRRQKLRLEASMMDSRTEAPSKGGGSTCGGLQSHWIS